MATKEQIIAFADGQFRARDQRIAELEQRIAAQDALLRRAEAALKAADHAMVATANPDHCSACLYDCPRCAKAIVARPDVRATLAAIRERREVQEDVRACEHGCDRPAPAGKKFCSTECHRCERDSANGCDGYCQQREVQG